MLKNIVRNKDYMKRYKYIPGSIPGQKITLFDAITSMDNLRLAYQKAARGKHKYPEVQQVDSDPERYLVQIRMMLINRTFTTSKYVVFEKIEGNKLRKIYKLPFFPDRIVQWAILLVIGPILERHFIYHTYSSIREKGPLLCMRNVYRAMHYDPEGTWYYIKIDIKKFYPSINHSILKIKYRRLFKDDDLLWLIDDIIDSLPIDEGIPIGNYLSQFSGNLYLTDFDHKLSERVFGVNYYFRYMDDIVIFSDSKEKLNRIIMNVIVFLSNEKLTLKSNYQINESCSDGLDFVGYRIFPDHILVRTRIKKHYIQAVKEMLLCRRETAHNRSRYFSYKGFIIHANSHNLQEKYGSKLEKLWKNEKTRL